MCTECKSKTETEDFNDSLEDIFGAPLKDTGGEVAPLVPVIPAAKANVFKERCPACRGTGKFYSYSGRYVGPCFKCGGKSEITFKTSPEARAKSRDNAAARKVRTAEENAADFAVRHPAIAAWYTGSDFAFAVAMREAVVKFGDLTEKQLAASYSCVAKLVAAKDAAKARRENAPMVDASVIVQALNTALGNGLRRPKLNIASYVFKFAPANGVNAGAVYVYRDGEYAGKIKDGKLFVARTVSAETEAEIARIAADPKSNAVAHGKMTGNCSCCGRLLTDPVSVANGIGPICAANYGW